MHEVLRRRLWRHIEALPEEQIYQVLDYIEFLSSKYNRSGVTAPASTLQRFNERLEDRMRAQGVGVRAIRGALDAIGTADRVVSGISAAGRSLLNDVESSLKPREGHTPTARRIAAPAEGEVLGDEARTYLTGTTEAEPSSESSLQEGERPASG